MDGGAVFEIVTNNPRLTADFAVSHGIVSVHRVEGSPLDVLDRAEALLQEGRTLVSAPLPPNVPLMRAPYRSLLLAQSAISLATLFYILLHHEDAHKRPFPQHIP